MKYNSFISFKTNSKMISSSFIPLIINLYYYWFIFSIKTYFSHHYLSPLVKDGDITYGHEWRTIKSSSPKTRMCDCFRGCLEIRVFIREIRGFIGYFILSSVLIRRWPFWRWYVFLLEKYVVLLEILYLILNYDD